MTDTVNEPVGLLKRDTLGHHDPSGRTFALWLVNVDGSGLERVTWGESFASFPMFSRDGTKLVFCSSRNAAAPRDLNVFVAGWVA